MDGVDEISADLTPSRERESEREGASERGRGHTRAVRKGGRGGRKRARETERDKQSHTHIHTHTHTARERDKQSHTHTHTHTHAQRERERPRARARERAYLWVPGTREHGVDPPSRRDTRQGLRARCGRRQPAHTHESLPHLGARLLPHSPDPNPRTVTPPLAAPGPATL
jgi:hypothetical protein